MKRILTPTDFSDCSKAATKVAAYIAKKANAKLNLMHLLNSHELIHFSKTGADRGSDDLDKAKAEAEKQLKALVSEVQLKDLDTEFFIGLEATVQEITKHVKKYDIDLVVMGSHGSSGFREAFLGSNTQKILRRCHAPVLVIKTLPKKLDFKNIVFASSFREDVHEAFETILKFARIFGAKIHLLYVNMPYNFEVTSRSLGRMQEFADKYPGQDFKMHIYNAFDEESGILKFSHSHNIDLIATTTHGKSGFLQMLSPSITESLANHSSLPVLSVNLK